MSASKKNLIATIIVVKFYSNHSNKYNEICPAYFVSSWVSKLLKL